MPTEKSVCFSKAWLPGRRSQGYMPLFAGDRDYQKIAWMWLILGRFEHHDIFRHNRRPRCVAVRASNS